MRRRKWLERSQQLPIAGRRSGYVLVLVLAMLTLAAVLAVGLARRSVSLALQAISKQERLQERWARLSLQRVVLGNAESLLDDEAGRREPSERAPAHVAFQLSLGGTEYELLLADENAKINLNTVFHINRREGVERVVRQFRGNSAALPVRLRPFAPGEPDERLPVFDSWGQVFDLSAGGDHARIARQLRDATAQLTCWGDGRINLQRASDEAIGAVTRGSVEANIADQLIEARAVGLSDVSAVFDRFGLRNTDRESLAELVALSSGCYSMWVTCRTGERVRLELYVAEQVPRRFTYLSTFMW